MRDYLPATLGLMLSCHQMGYPSTVNASTMDLAIAIRAVEIDERRFAALYFGRGSKMPSATGNSTIQEGREYFGVGIS